MALAITLNTLNGNASPFDGFSVGFLATWTMRITTADTFLNKTIYFNPALFIDPNTPNDDTNFLPIYGYSTTMTSTGVKQSAPIIQGSSPTYQNYECFFELISATELEVELIFQFTADFNSFMNGTTKPNNFKLTKNAYNNPNAFDNVFVPAVYNTGRVIRGHLVTGNITTGIVSEQIFVDFETEARWYESGLSGSAAEFTDWTLTLERAGNTVSTLSIYEDTTVKVTVDIGAGSIDTDSQITIFRVDDVSNTIEYIQDTDEGVHFNDLLLKGKDYISSYTGWSLSAGTVYEMEFVIDKNAVVRGGIYRILPIAFNAGNTITGSYLSFEIQANGLPTAITGTMTGEIFDYNEVYTGNCLEITAWERVKLCASVDKASYNLALSTAGLPGDFDTNLSNLTVQIKRFPDEAVIFEVNDRQDNPALEISDTFTTYTSCLTYRIPESLVNTPLAIDHIFTYNIDLEGNPYSDIVTFRQLINCDVLEENEANPDQVITNIEFLDAGGNAVVEICEDFNGPLTVRITKIATANDYNLIAALKPDVDGENVNEQEDYVIGYLPQLEDDRILTVDTVFGGDNIAEFTVDNTLLEDGVKYRMYAIAKEVNPSPPVICPIINVETITTCTNVLTVGVDTQGTFSIDYNITNLGGAAVTNVDILTNTTPKPAGADQNNNFVTASGNYLYLVTWIGGFAGDSIRINVNMEITLDNGCTYIVSFFHDVIPLVNSSTTLDEDVNAS